MMLIKDGQNNYTRAPYYFLYRPADWGIFGNLANVITVFR